MNTLGREKLKLRGSRVIKANENTDVNQYRNDHENESRKRHRTTHNYQLYSYDTRRTGSSRPYHNSYDDGRDYQYYYSHGKQVDETEVLVIRETAKDKARSGAGFRTVLRMTNNRKIIFQEKLVLTL